MNAEDANSILIDRAYRLGNVTKSSHPIPFVATFHYPNERENIRHKSFTCIQDLKQANMGIGVQLPKDIRDARKPLYPAIKKAKADEKHVRFFGAKLCINGEEHLSEMEH